MLRGPDNRGAEFETSGEGPKQIWVHFELEKTNPVMTNLIFVIFIAHIYTASLDIFFSFAGGVGPSARPPSLATPVVLGLGSQIHGLENCGPDSVSGWNRDCGGQTP